MMTEKKRSRHFTAKELRLNLYITQLLVLLISIILAWLLFDSPQDVLTLFVWDPIRILLIGGGAAICIVMLDYVAMKLFPESWFDDGGINERVFHGIGIIHLACVTLLIGFAEEFLFRGIVQTQFGFWVASLTFAVLHVRYIRKPFLFTFVLVISMFLGCLFELTGNLFITIFAHFLTDFMMGLHLREGVDNKGDEY
ncbi:CPBP family intramembrane glutamic endopeptidase [Ectobacillus antri]